MAAWNQLVLETLGSKSIMPKNILRQHNIAHRMNRIHETDNKFENKS